MSGKDIGNKIKRDIQSVYRSGPWQSSTDTVALYCIWMVVCLWSIFGGGRDVIYQVFLGHIDVIWAGHSGGSIVFAFPTGSNLFFCFFFRSDRQWWSGWLTISQDPAIILCSRQCYCKYVRRCTEVDDKLIFCVYFQIH